MSTPLLEHRDRDEVLSELHARPLELIPPNCRIRRLVLAVPTRSGAIRTATEEFRSFAARRNYSCADEVGRQYRFETGTRVVCWEFHTEFITITWYTEPDDAESWPDDIGLEVLGEAELLGGIRIDVLASPTLPERVFDGFRPDSLCHVWVEEGKAQLATDFVPDEEKFLRFEFAAGGLSPLRQAITSRRILEMETYRTMALLALPLARRNAPRLRAVEVDLTDLVQGLPEAQTTEEVQDRLNRLHELSVRSGQLSELLNYRFAAAYAYGAILERRVVKLREATVGDGLSLSSFIGNRVEPALATCQAMDKRLDLLSSKLQRAVELLNARNSLDVQVQNKAVLETIAETARNQLRLQHTVEGLSAIAITYYLIGIVGYALAGPLDAIDWSRAWALSLLAPVALIAVYFTLRKIRR